MPYRLPISKNRNSGFPEYGRRISVQEGMHLLKKSGSLISIVGIPSIVHSFGLKTSRGIVLRVWHTAGMTIAEYIAEFRFSPITTDMPVPSEATLFLHKYPALILQTEKWNTVFPPDQRGMQKTIEEVAMIHRLSTLPVGMLINEIVSRMPEDQAYVNVGVWHGYTLCAAFPGNEAKHCIGIDNFSEFGGPREQCKAAVATFAGGPRHVLYEADYRDYFKTHTLPIGFYFYDGEHSYANQLQGLEIAEPFLAPGAFVLVDDTNWGDPRNATTEFMKRHKGEYVIVADILTACDRHPTWWNGLMLLQKKI